MIYLLDTNVISDWIVGLPIVTQHIVEKLRQRHTLALCPPVYYEVRRGLLWKRNVKKLQILDDTIVPRLSWIAFTDNDWTRAAQFWADAHSKGKQFNDVDLFLAALAHRLNAIIVSSDADFDALPTKREDWRGA